MTLLPNALLYLVVALLEIVGVGETIQMDYLLDSSPALVLTLESVPGQDRDMYTLEAISATGQDSQIYPLVRIEQSDLYAYNYLIYMDGLPGPLVANTSAVLRQISRLRDIEEFEVDLGSSAVELAGDDQGTGVTLHFLVRDGHTVVAAPEYGIVLVTR